MRAMFINLSTCYFYGVIAHVDKANIANTIPRYPGYIDGTFCSDVSLTGTYTGP
jgi:hypothetical protein